MGWFGYEVKSMPEEQLKEKLKGKNVLIVGGTSGIGKALAESLLKREANVWIVGRRTPKDSLASAKFIQMDLTLMRNAKTLMKAVDCGEDKLDIILFAIGIISSSQREETAEGIEKDLAVSYLSRFAIAKELIRQGRLGKNRSDKSRTPRIYVLGFPGKANTATLDDFNSEKSYSAWPAHMNTVVGNEALITYLANGFSSKGENSVNVYGLNPGLIKTEIRDNMLGKGSWASSIVETLVGSFFQSAEKYCENVLVPLLASDDQLEQNKNKQIFDSDGSILQPNSFLTEENLKRVIEESDKLLSKALSAKIKS